MADFCTLFDSNYLHYGLCLYRSLKKHCKNFHLYVFAFDDTALDILNKMALPCVTVISLSEFEDLRLLEIKSSRTKGEYCWTCTPSIIRYVLNTFDVPSCTYIDSDLFFFSDPSVLINEMSGKSVSIIEHRYHADYDQTKNSGKYCVQFMTFLNNEEGRFVLEWWRDACIAWCYNRFEDGKFGDQKYLDDWMERFNCVCELQNIGGGVAPWNVKSYALNINSSDCVSIRHGDIDNNLVFYHFHGLKIINRLFVQLTGAVYDINEPVFKYIYAPYLDVMISVINSLGVAGFVVKYSNNAKFKQMLKMFFGKKIKNACKYRNI